MRQAAKATDLESIDENIRVLKCRVDQFDDQKVKVAFSRLLDHMDSLREALANLEDLLRSPTSDSDQPPRDTSGRADADRPAAAVFP